MKSLKEWAAVVSALESGDQTVLLRKGGILEIASGFRIELEKFLLFPTAEHQVYTNIQERFHDHLRQAHARPQKKDHNMITSYAEVLAETDVASRDTLDRLSRFHIWSKTYIDERRMWKEEKPIKAVFLKVYKIPGFYTPLKPEYRGCKSWLDIQTEIPRGEQVLDDAEIKHRMNQFMEIVN